MNNKKYFANFNMLGFKKEMIPVKDAREIVKHLYMCPYNDCGSHEGVVRKHSYNVYCDSCDLANIKWEGRN